MCFHCDTAAGLIPHILATFVVPPNMSMMSILVSSGAKGRSTLSYTFASNTANASLNVTSISGYSAGKSDITITVNSGIYLYSTSTSNAGLTLTGGSSGDTITLVNNGYIMGMGGVGGGYDDNAGGYTTAKVGGTALSLGFNTTVNNTNASVVSAAIGGALTTFLTKLYPLNVTASPMARTGTCPILEL